MKRLILSLVVGGFLLSCTGIVYSVENSGRENQIEEEIAQVWSETISEYTARIIYVLEKMQKNTSSEQTKETLKEVFNEIQQMRDKIKLEGIIVEGFSLNLDNPSSITVKFKFKEE